MRCRDLDPELLDLATPARGGARATDGRAAADVQAHLRSCADCAARVALWQDLGPALRDTLPEPPDALRVRRMERAIEHRLVNEPMRVAALGRVSWRPWVAGAALGFAVLALWLVVRRPHDARAWGAAVMRADGAVTIAGRTATAGSRLLGGQTLAVAAGGVAALGLDGAASLLIDGPAELGLDGEARHVVLRLERGTLAAEVAHRAPGDTFWVAVRGGRVEVRGTRFTVRSSDARTAVAVQEGRVLVHDDAGREILVGAGESADVPLAPPAPGASAAASPAIVAARSAAAGAGAAVASCDELLRACQTTARRARGALRAGEGERARRLAADGARAAHEAPPACAAPLLACDDDLRYLNAETLQVQGRLDAAARAFRALDRPGAPSATRQNALYAAARLDQRLGRPREASTGFERALEAAPAGALREESLGGAMESAAAAGDQARATALARRYLAQFPGGLMARAARRLAGGATGAPAPAPK